MAELLVLLVVIGILAAITIPLMASYLRSSTVTSGAQEVRTALQQAKQLAITARQTVCVQPVTNGYQVVQGGCPGLGPYWTGAGWSAAPITLSLQNGVALAGAGVAFTPLGAAAPAGTFTVTGPGGNALTVTVSVAGRITTP